MSSVASGVLFAYGGLLALAALKNSIAFTSDWAIKSTLEPFGIMIKDFTWEGATNDRSPSAKMLSYCFTQWMLLQVPLGVGAIVYAVRPEHIGPFLIFLGAGSAVLGGYQAAAWLRWVKNPAFLVINTAAPFLCMWALSTLSYAGAQTDLPVHWLHSERRRLSLWLRPQLDHPEAHGARRGRVFVHGALVDLMRLLRSRISTVSRGASGPTACHTRGHRLGPRLKGRQRLAHRNEITRACASSKPGARVRRSPPQGGVRREERVRPSLVFIRTTTLPVPELSLKQARSILVAVDALSERFV